MNNLNKTFVARHILFQRTNLQIFGNSQILNRIFSNKFCVMIDSIFFNAIIIHKYLRECFLDYESIRKFIPKQIYNSLDIGCGLAGIDSFIFREYSKANNVHLHLADKDGETENIQYNYRQTADIYNNLENTVKFLIDQGLPKSALSTTNVVNNKLPQDICFELIFSLLSWGFHYPVITYLDYVHSHLTESGVVILDCRKGTDDKVILCEKFEVVVINDNLKSERLCCRKK
jgi:hypothetical protein